MTRNFRPRSSNLSFPGMWLSAEEIVAFGDDADGRGFDSSDRTSIGGQPTAAIQRTPFNTRNQLMRSDHWNFLANLLGTPGPAEPPKETDPESAEPESATGSGNECERHAEKRRSPTRDTAQPDSDTAQPLKRRCTTDRTSGAEVLDALDFRGPLRRNCRGLAHRIVHRTRRWMN